MKGKGENILPRESNVSTSGENHVAEFDESKFPLERHYTNDTHCSSAMTHANEPRYVEAKPGDDPENGKPSSSHTGKLDTAKKETLGEDFMFQIKDNTTGAVYDVRNELTANILQEEDKKLTTFQGVEKNEAWDTWWAFKRERCLQLTTAAEKGETEKALELLDAKRYGDLIADVNTKGLDDYTPLHSAVSEGHTEMVKLLLAKGALVNSVTTSLRAPLHIACYRGYQEIIEKLIDSGANINAQDMDGNTPAHILSEEGKKESLELLLRRKPDLSLKNKYGEVACEVAASVDIKNLFELHAKAEHGGSDSYSRVVVDNVIIHNNRADMIKSLMFKGRFISSQMSPPTLKKTAEEEAKIPPKIKENRTRRIQIIEAAKMISTEKKPAKPVKTPVKAPAKDEAPHDVVSVGPEDFLPIQLLGKGSFGEVYLVKYKATGELYAMKVLNKSRVMSQNLFKYAMAERNVLCYTKHPFIVGLEFAFQTSEKLFLILEFCPGGDLGKLIQKEKKFSEEKAKIYAAEILLALEDLHKRDIIFRDLKPENVVIDAEGHAMLTDFGLSKEGVKDNSSAKSFCGSVAYLAPEILMKKGHGKSLDWYLLGLIIYEMLVGIPPYYSTNKEQLFTNIKSSPLKMPYSISAEGKDLIIKLLSRSPDKRLGSAKTDAEEIKKHPWFATIDWGVAMKRGLTPAKPLPKLIPSSHISPDIFADPAAQTKKIPNWTFIGNGEPN